MPEPVVNDPADNPLLDEEGTPVPTRHADHFNFWKAAAVAQPAGSLRPPNVEGSLAYANCETTLRNLAAHEARIRAIPGLNQELIWGLTEIAAGFIYAQALWAILQPAAPEAIAPLMRELRRHRKFLLHVAHAAAAENRVDEKTVDAIHKGKGSLDQVGDVLKLAPLLRAAEGVVAPGSLVTEEKLRNAEAVALQAQRRLRPSAATNQPAPTDEEKAAAALLRDQFFTLLLAAVAQAELAAAHIVGVRNVSDLVIPLNSRQGLKKQQPPASE